MPLEGLLTGQSAHDSSTILVTVARHRGRPVHRSRLGFMSLRLVIAVAGALAQKSFGTVGILERL